MHRIPNISGPARCLLLSLLMLGVMACRQEPIDAVDTTAAAAAAVAAATFASEQKAWRARRLDNLLKPDGWTSLIGLHWIEPGAHFIGTAADNGIRLTMGPRHLGLLRRDEERLSFTPADGAAVTLDGEPMVGNVILRSDADEGGPSVIGFDNGKGEATVIVRDDRAALRVKHADALARRKFAGLDYWPGGMQWKVEALFEPHNIGTTIAVASIIGTVEEVANPGAVVFEHGGKTYRIEALDEGGDELFLVFADGTSGQGSYSAGRFLYVPKPDATGKLVVDFNQSYNPPCAFTSFATCPLPPPENRIELAITAGEKAYSKPE